MRLLYLALFGLLATVPLASHAAAQGEVPSWIKNIAGFWYLDQISDAEFLSAIEYLVSNGIIKVSDGAITSTPIASTPNADTPDAEQDADPVEVGVLSWTSMVDMISVMNGFDKSDPKILDKIQSWLDEDEDLGKDYEYMEMIQQRLEEIPFSGLVRYNSEYVGEEVFLLGKAVEVKDIQNNQYEVQMAVDMINFEEDGGAVVVKYSGSRIRDGDTILATGAISGLQIVEVQNDNLITKIKDAGIDVDSEEGRVSTQVELPVMTASGIHRLVDPTTLIPRELERTYMTVPYDNLSEYDEILDGTIVYYQGTVTSVKEQSFRLDVNPALHDIDMLVVRTGDETISTAKFQHTPEFITAIMMLQDDDWDIEKNDKVDVYGLVTASSSTKTPDVYALHISACGPPSC